MSLDQHALDQIERIIYKNGDDIAVSIARSFERLEERIDATESRLHLRIAEVEERIDTAEHNLAQDLESLRDVLK